MIRVVQTISGSVLAITVASAAMSATITADTILEFFDSGTGPLPGPYGAASQGAPIERVPLSYITDDSEDTFVSLPPDTFVTLGFSEGFIFDGDGDDIFISEVGDSLEEAEVFVSSDLGATFTSLGIVQGNVDLNIDLGASGYAGTVNAINIVGLDSGGTITPGFDLAQVRGLEGSIGPISPIPVPASLPLLISGIVGTAFIRRRACRS